MHKNFVKRYINVNPIYKVYLGSPDYMVLLNIL